MYVLLIRRVTLRDAGMYMCELNSPNVTRSFHELKIISDRLMAPVVASDHDDDSDDDSDNMTRDSIDVWNYSTERPVTHDYMDCCMERNVTKKCLDFCNIKNILDGDTGQNIICYNEPSSQYQSCSKKDYFDDFNNMNFRYLKKSNDLDIYSEQCCTLQN